MGSKKVRSIFVRDEIFEKISRTQRIDKGKHKGCFSSHWKSFVFDWNFQKISSFFLGGGALCCNFTPHKSFLDFLDSKLCRFFVRSRRNRPNQAVLHAQRIKRKMYYQVTGWSPAYESCVRAPWIDPYTRWRVRKKNWAEANSPESVICGAYSVLWGELL